MNPNMTDYIILSVENPAFTENIQIMVGNILAAGGTSPTLSVLTKEGDPIPDTDPVEYEQIKYVGIKPMVGTGGSNGRVMFHFRLPDFYNSADLITFLQQGMGNPKPPISAESIRSAYKTLWIDDGLDGEGNPIGHYEYVVTVQAMRAKFLPYMTENTDENGNPNGTINEFLSSYFGADPIELA